MHAQLRRLPPAGYGASAACPWPSAEQPTVSTGRLGGTDAVRYTSVDAETHRLRWQAAIQA
jgi:hypothetical protein